MMIFQHTWQQAIDGIKTQSRRLIASSGGYEYQYPGSTIRHIAIFGETPQPTGKYTITTVFTNGGREKWRVGKDYAVQKGRGKKAIARIMITGIQMQRLQDISEEDAVAEGCSGYSEIEICANNEHTNEVVTPADDFAELWDSIHTTPGDRWQDNPTVFVLEFELVEEDQ